MSRKSSSKPKKWFIKIRGSYLPSAWQGWLSYIPYVGFLVISFISVNNRYNSATDVIVGIVPYWVSAVVVMHWFASRNS